MSLSLAHSATYFVVRHAAVQRNCKIIVNGDLLTLFCAITTAVGRVKQGRSRQHVDALSSAEWKRLDVLATA